MEITTDSLEVMIAPNYYNPYNSGMLFDPTTSPSLGGATEGQIFFQVGDTYDRVYGALTSAEARAIAQTLEKFADWADAGGVKGEEPGKGTGTVYAYEVRFTNGWDCVEKGDLDTCLHALAGHLAGPFTCTSEHRISVVLA